MSKVTYVDLDECNENGHDCNESTSVCVNTFGGYTCDCLKGFNDTAGVCTCELHVIALWSCDTCWKTCSH